MATNLRHSRAGANPPEPSLRHPRSGGNRATHTSRHSRVGGNPATLITECLDIWTSADSTKKSGRGRSSGNSASVYGIKKLRALILELAVRGKLVQQDPNDESTHELLKRIQVEKAKLAAEGKIKKNKLYAPISDDSIPFDLPTGWSWVRVGQICHDWGQKTPDKKFNYIDVSAIDNASGVISTPEILAPENAPSRARKIVKQGTLIYSTIRPYLLNAAVVNEDFSPEPIASTAFAVVHPFCSMPPRYFLCVFRSPIFVRFVESVQMGIAYPAINDAQFFSGLIPLPPEAEQHRIVAQVDELMALCDQLEAQHNNAAEAHEKIVSVLLETLTQSADAKAFAENWQRIAAHFDTLFTTETSINALKQTLLQLAVMGKLVPQDPNDEPAREFLKHIEKRKVKSIVKGNHRDEKLPSSTKSEAMLFKLPSGWELVSLDQISQVGTGATPLRTKQEYFKPAIFNWVTSGETSSSRLFETEQFVSLLAIKETNLTVYPIGTLIIAMYGQGKTRGQVTELMIEACTNQACAAIRLNCADDSHRAYVKLFFEKIYDEIRELAAGGAQPNLNLSKIKETLLPLPPLAEQHRIVAKVDELMTLCEQLKSRITAANQCQQKLADVMIENAMD